MKKEKFHIEYIFEKVSKRSLWNHLTTEQGLSLWFADDVKVNNNIYTFYWKNMEQEAEVLLEKPERTIRYRWIDEEKSDYFEFIIHTIELTGSIALEITDFSEAEEMSDAIELWDTQVEVLKRTLGI